MELNPESTVVQAGVPDEDHAVHGDLLGVVEVDIAGLHGGAVDVVSDLDLQWKHVEGVQHGPEVTAVSGEVSGDAFLKYFLDCVLRQPQIFLLNLTLLSGSILHLSRNNSESLSLWRK